MSLSFGKAYVGATLDFCSCFGMVNINADFFPPCVFWRIQTHKQPAVPFSCACLPAGGIDGTNTYLHVMETGKIKACVQGVGFVSSAGLCVAVVVHLVGGF